MSKSDVFHLGLTKNDLQGATLAIVLATRIVWKDRRADGCLQAGISPRIHYLACRAGW